MFQGIPGVCWLKRTTRLICWKDATPYPFGNPLISIPRKVMLFMLEHLEHPWVNRPQCRIWWDIVVMVYNFFWTRPFEVWDMANWQHQCLLQFRRCWGAQFFCWHLCGESWNGTWCLVRDFHRSTRMAHLHMYDMRDTEFNFLMTLTPPKKQFRRRNLNELPTALLFRSWFTTLGMLQNFPTALHLGELWLKFTV